ncbi:MAG: S41 family peptidase [Candidatus Obscuribacterales bacterium]|nr:S41 family peptidase [Candidatus Obscuribacterales bacterium]
MQVSAKTSTTKDRVLEIGRIWATAGLFHPRLPDKDENWAAAFARAKGRAELYATAAEHQQNVQMMLEELSDPSTHVLSTSDVPFESSSLIQSEPDAIPEYVHVDGAVIILAADTPDLETFKGLLKAITDAKLIFDLRGYNPYPESSLNSFDTLLHECFCRQDVQAPIRRSKYFSGYPTEIGDWGYFYSGWSTRSAETFSKSDDACSIKPCLLVDYQTSITPLMLAMHDAELISIVSRGAIFVDSHFPSTTIECGGDLKVMLRLEDYSFSSGKTQFEPDKIFGSTKLQDDQKLFEAIAAWLNDPEESNAASPDVVESNATLVSTENLDGSLPEMMLSSLFRIWAIIKYFFPYLNLMTEDWETVVDASYESFENCTNSADYTRAVEKLVSHLDDSHVSVYEHVTDAYALAAPHFSCRIIESQAIITQVLDSESSLSVGDMLVAIDSIPVQSKTDALKEICAASTPQSLNEIICERLLVGKADSEVNVTIENSKGELRSIALRREPGYWCPPILASNAVNSPFKKLDDRLGYVDLTQLGPNMIDEMFKELSDTAGLIFDMRGYPCGTFEIASRLCIKRVPAVRFIRPYVNRPHQNYYIYDHSEPTVEVFFQDVLPSPGFHYSGKTAMLIDGRTISQAEKMAMFFKAANDTCLIGEPSAGANGTVTNFVLPGSLQVCFTGDAITYPDGRQTQRVGIQPDIFARATIESIRNSVDVALDAAINYLRNAAIP